MKRPWQHQSNETPWKQKSNKYGNTRFDGEFYQSKEWRNFREYIKQRKPMLCADCGRQANYLDHIQPIRLGGAKLDEANVQWLCARCHTIKTNKERNIKE